MFKLFVFSQIYYRECLSFFEGDILDVIILSSQGSSDQVAVLLTSIYNGILNAVCKELSGPEPCILACAKGGITTAAMKDRQAGLSGTARHNLASLDVLEYG